MQFREEANAAHVIMQDYFGCGTRNKQVMSIYSVDAKTVSGRNTHMHALQLSLARPHHFCKYRSFFFVLPFSSRQRRHHTVLHGLLVTPVSQLPCPTSLKLYHHRGCTPGGSLGTLLAVHRRCRHPRWEPVSPGRNSNAKKVPLACSEISPGVCRVGRVWAWQRSVHRGKKQIVTQRKGFSRLPLTTWIISTNKT